MSEDSRTIDSPDRRILELLQADARISNAELARRVGMAPSAVFERVRKLEARGLVRGYEARLDAAALGLGVAAFVLVRADERVGSGEVGARLAALPEVLEVHHIAGEDCYLVKVRVADTEALSRLLRERFGTLPEVRSTRTTVVLSTLKETARLPIELDATAADDLDAVAPPSGRRDAARNGGTEEDSGD
jgi:Lrp/AsnC family leucine-responsive transcriptional regulator